MATLSKFDALVAEARAARGPAQWDAECAQIEAMLKASDAEEARLGRPLTLSETKGVFGLALGQPQPVSVHTGPTPIA